MSPSSRGLVPGLLLAVAVAFAVLAANDHWLFPALDDTGVRYLAAAPDLAAGRTPAIPISTWDSDSSTTGLEAHGKLTPWLMAAGIWRGARAHVAGLWVVACAAGVAALGMAWAVGGASGIGGAVVAGLMLLASPVAVAGATTLGPDFVVAALTLVLLGIMTYQPGWSLAHGAVAALAWMAGPAGIGAVAAALVWPSIRRAQVGERTLGVLLALVPAAALMIGGARRPDIAAPAWAASRADALRTAEGIARWASGGVGGSAGMALGVLALAALGALVVSEAASTETPAEAPPWSDPSASDWLAARFRPAGATLAVALAGGAAGAATGALGRPWLSTTLVLSALAAATVARWSARRSGIAAWGPALALGAWLCAGAWHARTTLVDGRATGRGVTSQVWVESPVIRWIDNRSSAYPVIYATEPALVLLQTGRGARTLPAPGADLDGFAERYARRGGALVLTAADTTAPWVAALGSRLGLETAVRTEEGIVLTPSGSSN